MNLAYKVVRRTEHPNIFASAIASDQLCLEYRLDEWTTVPKFLSQMGLYPCVFSSEFTARHWVEGMLYDRDFIILLCEVKDPLPELPNKLREPSLSYRSRLLLFLRLIWVGRYSSFNWPYDTNMVKQIRPIKVV